MSLTHPKIESSFLFLGLATPTRFDLLIFSYVLQSKSLGKYLLLEKHDPFGCTGDKKSASFRETDNLSNLPHDNDQKEKFKIVIDKTKKDGHEPTSGDPQHQMGVSMDAATAAAILQAASRGIKNPSLEIFSKSSSGNDGLDSDGGYLYGLGSVLSSQLRSSVEKSKQNAEGSVSVPVAKAIAETAAIAAAGEADSSEVSMPKEQKLKAERLKRAKMFAAMIKSGSVPNEPVRGISAEPPGSGISGSSARIGNVVGKEREGSSVPHEVDNSDKSPDPEDKHFVANTERRSKRKYRSRSSKHEEEDEIHDNKDHKHSRRKHRSHRSSHSSRDRHKHKRRHSSSKDRDAKRTRHDISSDDEFHRDHHHIYDSSSDERHHSSHGQHRESNSSDERYSGQRNMDYNSSEGKHRDRHRTGKHRRSEVDRGRDLEEGEINTKSDQSRANDVRCAGSEASVELSNSNHHSRGLSQPSETTDISDELRAKIRAMLAATL